MTDSAEQLLAWFVGGGNAQPLNRGGIDLIKAVAQNPALILKFRSGVSTSKLNKADVRLFLKIVAAEFDAVAQSSDNRADMLDRYIAPVSGTAFVGGFIASNTQPAWAGAPLVAAAGAFALAAAGALRFWVKRAALSDKAMTKMIDLMTDI